jgi:hypothetical protein
MGMPRFIPIVLTLLLVGVDAAGTPNPVQQPGAVGEGSKAAIDASQVILPCIPVATYWTGSPPAEGMPPGPDLAVVSTKVRPKNARVYLDDRFVGRARYLDGRPGYLYLEPGSYQLELRLEGYRTVLVELDAQSGCRYDLKHRLERAPGPRSHDNDVYGEGRPFNRVFGPIEENQPTEASPRSAGPDPSLRKDLDVGSRESGDESARTGAALRLRVTPESATVTIDGEFMATGGELELMEQPLAIPAGKHLLVIGAPGYSEFSKEIEVSESEVVELEVSLSRDRTE